VTVPQPTSSGSNGAVSTEGSDLRTAASSELALRFPERWLEENVVLPLETDANGVVVVAAPGNVNVTVSDTLQRVLRSPVRFVVVAEGDLRAALLATDRNASGSSNGDSPLIDSGNEDVNDLRAMASREPVVQVVNAILAEAVQSRASDIHIESTANGLRVRFRLDGVLRDAQTLGLPFKAAVLSRIKVLAGLDIAERRLPQDGRSRVRVGSRDIDIRVSTLPALHGESIVLRLLDQSATTRTLTTLGIAPDIHERLSALLTRSSGLVLVTGPTGSGKTTTLYAALAARSVPGIKVVTVEDPVEYRLDGITQLPVNTKAGFGFANALRAILRHDPDVILVGEMRDTETAEIAVQASLTGHLVLSTLHTTDAASAITRLTEMGIEPYLVAATVQGVLAQRLVRTVCDNCATWHEATPAERTLMRTDSSVRVRRPRGCDACAGTGFTGRAAIAELLIVSEQLRSRIVAGAPLDELRKAAVDSRVRTLHEDGWRLVRDGRTTVDEVVRVVSEDEAR
jgi:general secretion pathway protein E